MAASVIGERTRRVQQAVVEALPDATVHASTPDGDHYEALVISPSFEGLALVKQHQAVMRALKEVLAGEVHAIQIKTFSPAKWEQEKHAYNISA